MSVRAKCPIHGHDLQPKICAGCSCAIIAADMLNDVPAKPAPRMAGMNASTVDFDDGSSIVTYDPIWFDD